MEKIKIENESTRSILSVMYKITNSKRAKQYLKKKSSQALYNVIFWDAEKKNLVATDGIMILIYNIIEKSLVEALGDVDGYFLTNSVGNSIEQILEPLDGVFPPYRNLLSKWRYNKYVELQSIKENFHITPLVNRFSRNFDLLYEVSVCMSGSLFCSDSFNMLSTLEFDTIWFDDTKDNVCRPVRLKNNKERILAMIMPLMPAKIEIKTKT